MDITVDWSNLPWPLIGEKLKFRIEYLRFRSVCPSFRSYMPPFHPSPSPKFPLPHSSDGPTSFLSQSTVYLLRPLATSSLTGSWLVKVEECDKMVLRNPITSKRINSECFNLLEFDMIELGKSYFLRYIHGSGSAYGLKKVTVVGSEIECAVVVISDKGELVYARSGDRKLRWFGQVRRGGGDRGRITRGQRRGEEMDWGRLSF